MLIFRGVQKYHPLLRAPRAACARNICMMFAGYMTHIEFCAKHQRDICTGSHFTMQSDACLRRKLAKKVTGEYQRYFGTLLSLFIFHFFSPTLHIFNLWNVPLWTYEPDSRRMCPSHPRIRRKSCVHQSCRAWRRVLGLERTTRPCYFWTPLYWEFLRIRKQWFIKWATVCIIIILLNDY
jgi:hypothetical protein